MEIEDAADYPGVGGRRDRPALDTCGHHHCLGGLGSAAMNKARETERNRARRYRDRADECRRNAAETKDPQARAGLIQVAQAYDQMAEAIEAKLDGDTLPNSN